jgi:NADPH:quinone reductase-like Zn-dependent oxidoreductase
MTTMKAIRIHAFGGPDVLRFEDVLRPEPKAGEALIRVMAAGVIATDWQFRSGFMPDFLGLKLPVIPGWDVAGTIEALGAGVTELRPGDPVYAMLAGHGGYAEFVAVPAAIIVSKPTVLSFTDAAAVPLAAMTAYKSLHQAADIRPGQTVLVHGASGGVGSFGVQFAKARGARVAAAARSTGRAFLEQLGADQIIDYDAAPFETQIKNVDVVLDVVGRDFGTRSLSVLKDGGLLVTIAGEVPDSAALAPRRLRAAFVATEPDGATLRAISQLIDDKAVRPLVQEVVPLAEAARAHAMLEAGGVRGKVVLDVASTASSVAKERKP